MSGSGGRHATSCRGASSVEAIVVIALVALGAIAAMLAFGRDVGASVGREGDCVRTLTACGDRRDDVSRGGVVEPARSSGGTGAGARGGDGSTQDAPAQGGTKGFWESAADVGKGFVVDGLWGTVTGVASAVAHPVDTLGAIGSALAHPVDTAVAMRDGVVTAWNENPERLVGAGVFEIVSLPFAAAKAGKATAVAAKVEDAARGAGAAAGRVERSLEHAGAYKDVTDR